LEKNQLRPALSLSSLFFDPFSSTSAISPSNPSPRGFTRCSFPLRLAPPWDFFRGHLSLGSPISPSFRPMIKEFTIGNQVPFFPSLFWRTCFSFHPLSYILHRPRRSPAFSAIHLSFSPPFPPRPSSQLSGRVKTFILFFFLTSFFDAFLRKRPPTPTIVSACEQEDVLTQRATFLGAPHFPYLFFLFSR